VKTSSGMTFFLYYHYRLKDTKSGTYQMIFKILLNVLPVRYQSGKYDREVKKKGCIKGPVTIYI
jgi:hypothetical protein